MKGHHLYSKTWNQKIELISFRFSRKSPACSLSHPNKKIKQKTVSEKSRTVNINRNDDHLLERKNTSTKQQILHFNYINFNEINSCGRLRTNIYDKSDVPLVNFAFLCINIQAIVLRIFFFQNFYTKTDVTIRLYAYCFTIIQPNR